MPVNQFKLIKLIKMSLSICNNLKFIAVVSFFLTSFCSFNAAAYAKDEVSQPLIEGSSPPRFKSSSANRQPIYEFVPSSESGVLQQARQQVMDELLKEIDPKPAEDEMNKIIDYLVYQQDDEGREEITEAYTHIAATDLPSYLLREAWGVVERESLNNYLGNLLVQNKKLQAALKELQRKSNELESEKKSIVQTWAAAMQHTYAQDAIIDLSRLEAQTGQLRNTTQILSKKNRYLKIALGVLTTASVLAFGAAVTFYEVKN